MNFAMARFTVATAILALAGLGTVQAQNNNNRRVPTPAESKKVLAAKQKLTQAKTRLSEARASVTRARMDMQKALKGGQAASSGVFKTPELVQAEADFKGLKEQLEQLGKRMLLKLKSNRELIALQDQVQELGYKLKEIELRDVDRKERVSTNAKLIRAKQDLKKLELKLLLGFPEYKELYEKLQQAEVALKEARRLSAAERKSQSTVSTGNPAVDEARSQVEQLVGQSKEANSAYMTAKREYDREVAIATAEYKQYLIQQAQEEQERRIREAQRNNNRRRRGRR